MKNKKVIVTLKYCKGEINPFDGAALEVALEMGFSDVTVVAMAPPSTEASLRSLTRLGIHAILLTDHLYAGSDTVATSYILAELIKTLDADIIFAGRQSIDGDTAQVPPMLAQRLGFSLAGKVVELREGKLITRRGDEVSLDGHSVITFERMRTLRFPSMFSKPREVKVIDNAALMLDASRVGLRGSPTRVIKSYESTVGRRACRFIDKCELDRVIKESVGKERKEGIISGGAKVPEAFYFGNIKELTEGIAEVATFVDHAGMDPDTDARLLCERGAKVALFEGTDSLKELAARVAVVLEAGLCADCISFRAEDGKFVMTRPAGGGNVTADIVATSDIALATVKTAESGGADIVFSVGKGAIPYIDKIKDMSAAYGAELCCSRIVTDSGRMPYSAQVGLTGKSVAPSVYVCFGISGAVQHTVGISGARTVIAINNDKNSTIFDYADYGIVADLNDL